MNEAIKPGTLVKIIGGPKDVRGKIGRVGEISKGLFKGADKTFVVDYSPSKQHVRDDSGKLMSVSLQRKDVQLVKMNESTDRYQGWDPELLKIARQYDRAEVNKGLNHEMEHNRDDILDLVDNKNDVLKNVLTHLEEDPQYYTNFESMESESYAPSETPQTRDPYRQGGFTQYTHVSHNGTIPRNALNRSDDDGVDHEPLGRKRPRLKEAGEPAGLPIAELRKTIGKKNFALLENYLRGSLSTGEVAEKVANAGPWAGLPALDINGSDLYNSQDPHDCCRVEAIGIDDGSVYGASCNDFGVDPKEAMTAARMRIEAAGLRKFFNRIRKYAGMNEFAAVPGIRLRALVRPSLKGSIRFVEYDANRFEFKI